MATSRVLREEQCDLCMQQSCDKPATYLSTKNVGKNSNLVVKTLIMSINKIRELQNYEELLRLRDLPSLLPCEALLVDEDAEQFRYTQRGVSVIHLNGHLRREVVPVDFTTGPFLETSNDILNRS